MSFRPVLLLLTSLTASGCFAGSVQPWFAESERVEEPGAAGTWQQVGDHGTSVLTITALPGKAYRVDMTEVDKKDLPSRFVVGLARLGKQTWADAQLDKDDEHLKGVEGFVVRPHLAIRYSLQGDTLSLHLVDKDWFKQQVDKKRVKLAFIPGASEQEMLLFTGTTAQLTQGLKSLEKEPKAFEAPVVFARVKP